MTTELLNEFGITPGKNIAERESSISNNHSEVVPDDWFQVLDILRDREIQDRIAQGQFKEVMLVRLANAAKRHGLTVLRAISSNNQELKEYRWGSESIKAFNFVISRYKELQRDSS